LLLPGVTLYLIQRGNSRSACFFAEEDYRFYPERLADQARKHGCEIHAWCLMTNHAHLLLTPARPESAAMLIRFVRLPMKTMHLAVQGLQRKWKKRWGEGQSA
jgi:putative transposase